MQPFLAYILPVSGYPDQGLPGGGYGGRPDQGLPGYGHPDQGLPGYGHPGNRPPGSWGGPVDPGWGQGGGRPGQGLPPGPPPHGPGSPDRPDNTLPGGVHKGEIWVVAYHPDHGLRWVRVSDISAPGNELPGTPPSGVAGQPLPETPAPKK